MLFLQLCRVLFPLWSSPHKAEVRRGDLPADDGSRGLCSRGLRSVPLPQHHHSCLAPPASLSVHGSLSELPKQCHFGLGEPHIQGTHFEPLRVSELGVGWFLHIFLLSKFFLCSLRWTRVFLETPASSCGPQCWVQRAL